MTGWQDIATAPKDGTRVLLFSPDSKYGLFIGWWCENNIDPEGAWWPDDEDAPYPIDADPTKWQPLPAPPVAT